jgi:hypothetical protein
VNVRNPDGFFFVLVAIWGDAFVKTNTSKRSDVLSIRAASNEGVYRLVDTKFIRTVNREIAV